LLIPLAEAASGYAFSLRRPTPHPAMHSAFAVRRRIPATYSAFAGRRCIPPSSSALQFLTRWGIPLAIPTPFNV
jgi:hypothetical protein